MTGKLEAFVPDAERVVRLVPTLDASLIQVRTGLERERPVQVLRGVPGTGKTAILNALNPTLRSDYTTVMVSSSALDDTNFLSLVLFEGGLPSRASDPSSLLNEIAAFASKAEVSDHPLVILVDEAMHLTDSALCCLMELAAGVPGSCPPVRFVLASIDPLADRLSRLMPGGGPPLPIWDSELRPMTAAETEAYVRSELEACGLDENLFSDGALRQVIDSSGGIVRIVNRVCREALVRAEQDAVGRVSARHFGPDPMSGAPSAPFDAPHGGGYRDGARSVSRSPRRPASVGSSPVAGVRATPSATSSSWIWPLAAVLGLIVVGGAGWIVATLPTEHPDTMAGASEQPLALPDPPGRDGGKVATGVAPEGDSDSGGKLVQQVDALRSLAQRQREQGDLAGAVDSIAQALVLSAGDPSLRPIQTDLLAEQERDDDRLRKVETLRAQAERQRQDRDLTGALRAVNEALELNPASHRLLGLRTSIESELETVWAKEREVSALREQATAELAAGNLDTAIGVLEAAVAVTPRNAELLGLREEWVAEREARIERARRLAELEQATDAAQAAGEFDQAIEQIDRAVALAPDDPALTERRTELLAARDSALELRGQLAALLVQAESAYSDGDLDRAIGLLDQAMALELRTAELDAMRSVWVVERDAALALRRQAAEALQTALAAADRGDFDTALERISAALALSPSDPELVSVEAELRASRDDAVRLDQEVAMLREAALDAGSDGDYELAQEKVAQAMVLRLADTSLQAFSARLERDRLEQGRRQERVARLRADAERQRATGDLGGAMVSLETALAIPEADYEVQSLYAEVNAAYAAQRNQAAKLERIESEVRRLLDAGDLDGAVRTLEDALQEPGDAMRLRALLTELQSVRAQGSNQHSAEHGREFVERGDALLQLGDVASARLFYREAIAAGNERAAMCLAVTYDPTSLQALGIQGAFTDRALAESLYRQAIAAGESEAGERLKRLLQQGDAGGNLQ